MKELRLVILDEKSAERVCAWIAACVVVHNFLIVERMAGDMAFDEVDDDTLEDEPSEQAKCLAEKDLGGSQRRAELFSQFILQHGY